MEVLDEIILTKFIPTISNGVLCSELERKLILLPPKLGGLGIPIFSESSEFEFENSITITESLKQNIKSQNPIYNVSDQKTKKANIKAKRCSNQLKLLNELKQKMSAQQLRLNELACEKHASQWITTLPIKEEGYVLTKQQFWDLIRLRYGW